VAGAFALGWAYQAANSTGAWMDTPIATRSDEWIANAFLALGLMAHDALVQVLNLIEN
jgi:hypothetical protein